MRNVGAGIPGRVSFWADGETIAGSGESQCQTLANLGADLLRPDELGSLARRADQANRNHNDFKANTMKDFRDMVHERVVASVRHGYEKLRGKCDLC